MNVPPICIPWPQKKSHKQKILPLFIPFAGCERRCIFCAQDKQSGKRASHDLDANPRRLLQNCLAEAKQRLVHNAKQGLPPLELAFYGGTFTALDDESFALCVDFAEQEIHAGRSSGARCSTRPDAVLGRNQERLMRMRQAGFHTIELGVQSFDDHALHLAKRHYTTQSVHTACTLVQKLGFSLGVQLMPGMPGVSTQVFLQDVQSAIEHKADFLRFYPCQVIAGTELATLWERGEFKPWELDTCLTTLSKAWLMAHMAHIPVIRMGLAPEVSLSEHILAGPRHPALGSIVQGLALQHHIYTNLPQGARIQRIFAPKGCQGYFWGHEKNLCHIWEKMGIHHGNITWHAQEEIILTL